MNGTDRQVLAVVATTPRLDHHQIAERVKVTPLVAALSLRRLTRAGHVLALAGPEHGDPARYRLPNT